MKMEDAGEITIKLNLDTEEFDKNFEGFKNKLETVLGLNSVENTPQRITGTMIIRESDSWGRQFQINYYLRDGWILLDSRINKKGEACYLIGTIEPHSTHDEFSKIIKKTIDKVRAANSRGY